MHNLLLYDLFNELRKERRWASLGLNEYYTVLELLESGAYPVRSFEAFVFVLETVWLKSVQHQQAFRELLMQRKTVLLQLFDQVINASTNAGKGLASGDPGKTGESDKDKPAQTDPLKSAEIAQQEAEAKQESTTQPKTEENNTGTTDKYSNTGFGIQKSEGRETGKLNISLAEPKEIPVLLQPYLFTDDYFPVKNRHLRQAWRKLKNKQEGVNSNEIHFGHTIERTARQGYFSSFSFVKKDRNQLRLFLFLDQSESMIAEEAFGEELWRTALESEIHPELTPWYFSKSPRLHEKNGEFLFSNRDSTQTQYLSRLFARVNKKHIVVMIYSDAGAFHDDRDKERLKQTLAFINHLYKNSAYLVWLNPAPRYRWTDTNAARIAQEVPMFEASRTEIENAMEALKGKITFNQQMHDTAS